MHLFADPEFWVLVAALIFVAVVWKPARKSLIGTPSLILKSTIFASQWTATAICAVYSLSFGPVAWLTAISCIASQKRASSNTSALTA